MRKRYNIRQVTKQGESGDVSGVTIQSWKERLPEILKKDDIYNLDEMVAFGELCLRRVLVRRERNIMVGKSLIRELQ